MRDFVIFTDSSCDMEPEKLRELGVEAVQLDVMIDEEAPILNCDVDSKMFYDRLRTGSMAKTAAVNTEAFLAAFRPVLEQGKDLLYLGFSSGLSNTYNAGRMAVEELTAAFPEQTVFAVDTLAASLGQGLLVYLATMRKRSGETIDEVRAFVEENKLHLCHWFTVDDLHFLKRGGRVNAAVAVLGSVLGIKPIMHTDNEGHLTASGKVRGRKAAIRKLAEKLAATALDPEHSPVFISHGDCLEEAEELAAILREESHVGTIYINTIGPVIGAHSGPGTIALFFLGKER